MRRHRLLTIVLLLTAGLGCTSTPVQPLEIPAEQTAKRYAADVTASDYSVQLDVLALGYKDGTFEVRSPAPHHVLSRGKHGFEVVNVALSNDAKKLATADAMGTLALSAVESGELAVLATSLPIEANGLVGLAWDAASRRLAVSAGTLIRIVDTVSGTVRETHLEENVRAVAFAPDGARLVAAGRSLHFLDLAELRVAEKHGLGSDAPNARITDIRFSPDGRLLGILMLGAAGFFDLESKQTDVAELRGLNPVGLRFAGDGRVAIFGRRALYVGPPLAKAAGRDAQPSSGELWDVQFRKDGSLLFVGDGADAELAALLPP